MNFKQYYLGCLSHASYYIGSGVEAAVIDPQRDIQQYLDEAAANGQKIKYVIETHSHADLVSGHIELAERTGAEIVFGQRAATNFPTHKAADGDVLQVGSVKLTFFETPGHTPEGICILAIDESAAEDEPAKLFTGDTLFIGDVGRPDLIGSKGFTAAEMAGMLYDSLHNKILPLADETEIYPAHGAGSLCGRSLSKETWSTLGEQRRHNYALQPMSKDEFITLVTADQPEVPAYFAQSAAKNLAGPGKLEDIAAPNPLSESELRTFDGVVLDVRSADEYGSGHIANSLNIGLGGQFATWAGTMIPIGTNIAVVAAAQEQIGEAVIRLARVGHETVIGSFIISDTVGETLSIRQVSAEDAAAELAAKQDVQFVDVRRPGEFAGGHARNAVNLPLDKLPREFDQLDPSRTTYVICQGGYRSSLATGILENAGFRDLVNISGGTAAWQKAELPLEEKGS